jgi:monovalent cation:H+ antiporter, CPA1 family
MSIESTLIILFSVATAVAIAARRLRVPYTVALVVVGLGLSTLKLIEPPHLTRELLFAFILPGLLFEAAFNLDMAEVRRDALAISALAFPGVVVAIALTAVAVTAAIRGLGLEPGFTLKLGFVFGGLIAATDPIAVVGLFRQMRVPSRLATLLEAESLLNDGTAIVFLTLIVAFVHGTATTPGAIALHLVTITGGGLAVGGLVGLASSFLTRQVNDAMIEITLTMITAYGSFVLGEQLHVSGVLATVAAGMVCAGYGKRVGMSVASQVAVNTFWEYMAFSLNSIVFLLIGFEVSFGSLVASWPEVTVAFAATLAARTGVVAGVTLLLRRTAERIPGRWSLVLTWGGLRGALSMVLALAVAPEFSGGSLLITMTFGVVLASLLIQGLSMRWLLRRLAIARMPKT